MGSWNECLTNASNICFGKESAPYELNFYLNNEGTGYVVGGFLYCDVSDLELWIPDEYNGLPVVEIGYWGQVRKNQAGKELYASGTTARPPSLPTCSTSSF